MTKPLLWIGDNFGNATGATISINLQESDGRHIEASVASMLILLDWINADERDRILSALRHSAKRGELNAADMQAHQA